jgi:RND family efflux transporter MFP subunit
MTFFPKPPDSKASAVQAVSRFFSHHGKLSQPVLALLVLAVGALAAWWLLETGPAAKEQKPKPRSVLVEVRPVVFAPNRSRVEAFGTVVPARQVELSSQVTGEMVQVNANLLPGGLVREGEILLGIEPADYALAVRQLAGEVAEAEAALKLEQGNRDVALREYELLGEEVGGESLDLVLRKPQHDSALARLEAARAKLAQAGLDLARTTVKAPFDAVVLKKEVDLGTRLMVNSPLVTLAGTARYWIDVVVPVGQLQWLTVPRREGELGSPVRVYDAAWGEGVYRDGHVLRLAADLEEQGRLARLLVEVDDPLGLQAPQEKAPRLFIGSYVRVEIDGRKLEAVATVERSLLRDGDQVWLMDSENRLEIRPVTVAFRSRDTVLVAGGLVPGERLVVSDLGGPVAGMRLRTPDMPAEDEGEKGKAEKNGGQGGKTSGGKP